MAGAGFCTSFSGVDVVGWSFISKGMNVPKILFSLGMLPDHRLMVRGDAEGDARLERVAVAFAEGDEAGLIALGAEVLPSGVDASLVFWHEFAADWLRALCLVPEGEEFGAQTIADPVLARCVEWSLSRPPMAGAEYMTEAAFARIWHRLRMWTVQQVNEAGDLGSFLADTAPDWLRVGRVTVHLAENQGDEAFPFAFVATYAAGLTSNGELRRLPLGRALQEFAGKGKKAELLRLLSPVHAAANRSSLIEKLVNTGDIFHPLIWTPEEAFRFLQEIPIYEECGLLARVPNWWRKRKRASVSITLGEKKGSAVGIGALLDFRMRLAMDGEDLTEAEIEALLDEAEGLVLLRGEWVEVDPIRLQEALAHWRRVEAQVGEGVSFIDGMRMLAGAATGLQDEAHLPEHMDWTKVEAGEELHRLLATLRGPEGLEGSVPAGLKATLRPYQLAGLNWMWLCGQLGLGACLADDMGLGKTIQVLSLLLRRQEVCDPGAPSLLVLPASLMGNWKAEAERFAPGLHVLVAHRSEQGVDGMEALAEDHSIVLEGVDLVITTYAMATRLTWLYEQHWAWIILDEAQAIKSPSAGQTRAVKQLAGEARVALTGTPVENRLGDLWSIFDFINPGLLGSAGQFQEFTQGLEAREPVDYAPLRNLVAPYILRRMKTDPTIAPDLPDKTEMQAYCGLAKPQAVLYKQAVASLGAALADENLTDMERRGLVLNYLMRFKQICNHPSQLLGDGLFDPAGSGKFDRLVALCREIAERGEKVLVFTQFKTMCEPLNTLLASVFGREGVVLHGGTPVGIRKDRVAAFQDPSGPPYFVLSIKAGGTGLNLTAASHVVHFDRWWNPAVENQATDRAFRIGQQRNVLVHKFVTRGTIEEKIDAMIREKQAMADALLEGGAETALTEMTNEEILGLVSLDIERASE